MLRAVLLTGGYSSAAASLGVAHATVRRSVQRLEDRRGARLFTHSPKGLIPTAAALELGLAAENMAAAASAFQRIASGDVDGMKGRVRVAVALEELMAVEFLPPILGRLRSRYPGLILELGLNVGWTEFRAGAADVAVRLSKPDDPDLDVREAGVLRSGLFAHRRYLEEAGTPASPEELARFALIGAASALLFDPIVARTKLSLSRVDLAFQCDKRSVQIDAMREGMGIAFCPLPMAAVDPDLIRLLPQIGLATDIWVAIDPMLSSVRRVAIVRDALVEELSRLDV